MIKADLRMKGVNELVTVIVPCYNYAHFLSQTLESVLAQTYVEWECIIVDDGSTDQTSKIAQSFLRKDNRFHYIYQKNQGLSAARNTGIKNSHGSFIQLLDADDTIERNKIATQLEAIQSSHADILYGDMRYFPSVDSSSRIFCMWLDPSEDKPWMSKVSGTGDTILKTLIKENIMVVNSPLIRRAIFDEVGLFNERLRSWEDWEFWLRCAIANKTFQYYESDESLALVRIHSESMSKNRWDMLYNSLKVRKNIQALLYEKSLKKINQKYISENLQALSRLVGEDMQLKQYKAAISKLKILYEETNLFKFKLLLLYARFLPDTLFQKIVSVHFQSIKTTAFNLIKKLFCNLA